MLLRSQKSLTIQFNPRSRPSRLDCVKIFFLILSFGATAARADLLYGVTSEGGITSGGSEFPNQNWNVGESLPLTVTSYTSPVLSASGSCALCGGTVSGSATAWASSNGGSLHGYATTAQSGICEENCVGGAPASGGAFYTQWVDTIYVTGLPNGTPVYLLLTDTLHSFSNFSGAGGLSTYLESVLALGSQDIQLLNNQGAANGLITQSVIVDTVSGATLQLAATLAGGASATDDFGGGSDTVDASDTANSYITVLTPGASYTTASGIGYTPPSTVPEPKNLWLMVTAFAGILVGTHRRIKLSDKKPARDQLAHCFAEQSLS